MRNPQRKLDDKCLCLTYVFGSVLACAIKSAHVFQELSYSLRGLCLSLSSLITLPQTVRLFYISLRSQAPQQQYTVLSFSSMRRHGHSHKLTSSLWRAPRFTLWAYLSEPLVKDSHKRSTEKLQYRVLQVTWSHITVTYVLRRGTRKPEEVGHGWPLLIETTEVTLIDLGYCKVESFLAFSMTGSSLESWFENWGPPQWVERASLLRYEKSISVTSAILISKVQPCPTSSARKHCTWRKWLT